MSAGHFTTPTLRRVLEDVFPASDSLQIARVESGVSTWVYAVDRRNERFYLRILPERDATFAPEAQAHQLALQAGAKAPELLYYQPRHELLGHSVMLTTAIPGQPIDRRISQPDAATIMRDVGRDLARIHSIPVEGFGWVLRDADHSTDAIRAEAETFQAAFLDGFDEQLRIIHQRLGSVLDVSRIQNIIQDEGEHVASEPSFLAHGDFDTSHVFVDASGYAGIIDFGEIRGAPRAYDLAHHQMHDRERLPYATLPHVLAGYEDISPLPADLPGQLRVLNLLIACRALSRGLLRDPASMIVGTSLASIQRILEETGSED